MLGHFPAPYPDELLYSVIARLLQRTGLRRVRDISQHIFGTRLQTAKVDFPTNLHAFVEGIPEFIRPCVDELVDQHTMLPLFIAFQDETRALAARQAMLLNGQPYLRLGVMASQTTWPRFFRYCPTCVLEDRREYGETYWHRVHHVPGIDVCATHGCSLRNSDKVFRHRSERFSYHYAESVVAPEMQLHSVDDMQPARQALAKGAAWLLTHPSVAIGQRFYDHCLNKLISLGIANYLGHLQMKAIHQRFQAQFPKAFLRSLGSPLEDKSETWLARLLRPASTAQQPIHYLLVAHFLDLKWPDIAGTPSPLEPFGSGPWPCLNTICPAAGKDLITKCDISLSCNEREPVGHFACPECGFTYLRTGPDTIAADRRRYDRVPAYGAIWNNELRRLWLDTDFSLRRLARHLGVDPMTVKKQASKVALPTERPGSRKGKIIQGSKMTTGPKGPTKDYIARWEALKTAKPQASITELRQADPKTYAFLYRHARDALKVERKIAPAKARRRVDWKDRDQNLAKQVRQAATRLMAEHPPRQLTQTALLNAGGCSWVKKKHLQKLPKVQAALIRLAEDRVAFAVRRINWVLALPPTELRQLKRWQIIRLSGLRADILDVPEVQSALSRATMGLTDKAQ